MSLADDCALEPVGEGRWRASIGERWWIFRGPYGGLVSALLAAALREAVPDRPPRTLAVHFLAAPAQGEVELSAVVERAGRSTTAVSLRLEQDGRPMALALAHCGEWREGEPGWNGTPMPRAPAPEDCAPDVAFSYVEQIDVRVVESGPAPRNLAWVRPRGETVGELGLVLLADTWMPVSHSHFGRVLVTPTYDLTIHFRAPVSEHEWVLAAFSSRLAAGGVWDEDGELWSPDGRLLVQSRQLAMIREPA